MNCPQCGESFEQLGLHFYHTDHKPELQKEQKEILKGVLMGDGCIDKSGEKPNLVINSINKKYLEYLDSKLGCHSTGVKHHKTRSEAREEMSDLIGEENTGSLENYNAIYRLTTRRNEWLGNLAEWYSSGKKKFPESLSITPTVLSHWYVCDGSYNNTGRNDNIQIASSNESENTEKVKSYFEEEGLPTPKYSGDVFLWKNKHSEEMFSYMNEIPGFDYKYPS